MYQWAWLFLHRKREGTIMQAVENYLTVQLILPVPVGIPGSVPKTSGVASKVTACTMAQLIILPLGLVPVGVQCMVLYQSINSLVLRLPLGLVPVGVPVLVAEQIMRLLESCWQSNVLCHIKA